MVEKRFIYDKKACIKLSDEQKNYIRKVEEKISTGEYKFEKKKCHTDFDTCIL